MMKISPIFMERILSLLWIYVGILIISSLVLKISLSYIKVVLHSGIIVISVSLELALYWYIFIPLIFVILYYIQLFCKNEAKLYFYCDSKSLDINKNTVWHVKNRILMNEILGKVEALEYDNHKMKRFLIPIWPIIVEAVLTMIMYFIIVFSNRYIDCLLPITVQ